MRTHNHRSRINRNWRFQYASTASYIGFVDLRRRLTWRHYGRRARKGDVIYMVRKLLRMNAEDLNYGKQSFCCRVDAHRDPRKADPLCLATPRNSCATCFTWLPKTPVHPNREAVSPRPCSASTCMSPTMPTYPNWLPSPRPSSSGRTASLPTSKPAPPNRVIKLEARNAYGFRNREHQRLRSRCATTAGSAAS